MSQVYSILLASVILLCDLQFAHANTRNNVTHIFPHI